MQSVPDQPGKLTALDAVLFQVKGVDDEMAVFRVEKTGREEIVEGEYPTEADRSLPWIKHTYHV